MSGQKIPSDWDGVTYRCCRIWWPDSPDWLDILLGQMVEPQKDWYWEVGSGDALQAELDLLAAELLTLPAFYQGCGMEAIGFRMALTQADPLTPDAWSRIDFNVLDYDLVDSGLDFANSQHKPAGGGLGLWHYDIVMWGPATNLIQLRLIDVTSGKVIAVSDTLATARAELSADWQFLQDGAVVELQGYAVGGGLYVAGTVEGAIAFLSGHQIGAISVVPPITGVYDGQVVSGSDDAHELDNDTSFNYTAVTMRVEANTSASLRWNCGARFQGVSVPPGATITAAYLSVVFPFTSRDSPRLTFRGNDVDNANSFSVQQDIFNRPRTTAGVDWISDDLGAGVYINSPDISSIIQEIVNRPGWVEGNAIAILAFGMDLIPPEASRFTPYEQATSQACKLHIEWQLG